MSDDDPIDDEGQGGHDGENDDTQSTGGEHEDDSASVHSKAKTVPPSATSRQSTFSRKGSANSQRSAAWSTGASSEKELIDTPHKGGGAKRMVGIVTGVYILNKYNSVLLSRICTILEMQCKHVSQFQHLAFLAFLCQACGTRGK